MAGCSWVSGLAAGQADGREVGKRGRLADPPSAGATKRQNDNDVEAPTCPQKMPIPTLSVQAGLRGRGEENLQQS